MKMRGKPGNRRLASRLAPMHPSLRHASDLLPTNPVVVRLVTGAGRRRRDLLVRGITLAALMLLVVLPLLSSGGTLKEMAQSGASVFTLISYGQLAAICLLTPLFMAGAIAQESDPRTWEILLTTPLTSLQIVLGNLAGRLFFAFALLLAALPLCLISRLFGGVRASSVVASLSVSACSALFLGCVAVLLSVLRSTGKRGVFAFYAGTVLMLFASGAADLAFRQRISPGSDDAHTTWLTPLNPFLTLRSALDSNAYRPWSLGVEDASWLTRAWFGHPLASMVGGSLIASMLLIAAATLRVRLVGSRAEAATGGLARLLRRVSARGERAPRRVWHNPVAWREASLRLSAPLARAARWGAFIAGVLGAVAVLLLHRTGALSLDQARLALGAMVTSEVVLAMLVAVSASATAVSREREDGSLDILLTTPIQPGPYLLGKLRGLIVVLWPAIAVPSITLLLGAAYVRAGGLGAAAVTSREMVGTATVEVPLVLAPAACAFPLAFTGFMAFTVMTGLQWSVGSRGVIGSTLGALGVIVGAATLLGLCGAAAGAEVPMLGPVLVCLSPVNLAFGAVAPARALAASMLQPETLTTSFIVGGAIAVASYATLTYAMLAAIRRSFMMTVRRLAGLK